MILLESDKMDSKKKTKTTGTKSIMLYEKASLSARRTYINEKYSKRIPFSNNREKNCFLDLPYDIMTIISGHLTISDYMNLQTVHILSGRPILPDRYFTGKIIYKGELTTFRKATIKKMYPRANVEVKVKVLAINMLFLRCMERIVRFIQ